MCPELLSKEAEAGLVEVVKSGHLSLEAAEGLSAPQGNLRKACNVSCNSATVFYGRLASVIKPGSDLLSESPHSSSLLMYFVCMCFCHIRATAEQILF